MSIDAILVGNGLPKILGYGLRANKRMVTDASRTGHTQTPTAHHLRRAQWTVHPELQQHIAARPLIS